MEIVPLPLCVLVLFGGLQTLVRTWLGVPELLWCGLMLIPGVVFWTYLAIKERRKGYAKDADQ